MQRAKVVSFANQKGGVTKTTTASAFSTGLTQRGYRVLAVDMDPQGNLSDSIGAEMYEAPGVYELLTRRGETAQAIQKLEAFSIIPANIMLAGAEQELSQTGKEYRLAEALAPVMDQYDYVVIDTPPSLGVLTVNAFTASDEVIIPTTAGIFAVNGIQQLFNSIESTRKYLKSNVVVRGILLTKYNPRAIVSQNIREVTEELAKHIHVPVFKTFIRNSVVVEEAQANRESLFAYSEKSTVADDYSRFVEEYLEEEGTRHGEGEV